MNPSNANIGQAARRDMSFRLVFTVALGLFIVGFVYFMIGYNLNKQIEIEADPPGDPALFDAFEALPDVKAFADGDFELTEISIENVRSDGTVDLTIARNNFPPVSYDFQRETDTCERERPPCPPPSLDGVWYEQITVEVGLPDNSRGPWGHFFDLKNFLLRGHGMEKPRQSTVARVAQTVVPDPACELADLWKTAIDAGMPENGLAKVDYEMHGADPRYRFGSQDGHGYLNFNADCTVEDNHVL